MMIIEKKQQKEAMNEEKKQCYVHMKTINRK